MWGAADGGGGGGAQTGAGGKAGPGHVGSWGGEASSRRSARLPLIMRSAAGAGWGGVFDWLARWPEAVELYAETDEEEEEEEYRTLLVLVRAADKEQSGVGLCLA